MLWGVLQHREWGGFLPAGCLLLLPSRSSQAAPQDGCRCLGLAGPGGYSRLTTSSPPHLLSPSIPASLRVMGTERAVPSTNLHTGARFYFRSGGERLPCAALTTRGYCDVSESLLSDSGDTKPSVGSGGMVPV